MIASMIRAYVGLGSNLGDRLANLRAGVEALDATPGVRVLAVSSAYETEPWGVADQPAFANAAAALAVTISAPELLAVCKRIEHELGRRPGLRYGPRPLDIDILLFGDEVIDTPELQVPHPRAAERDFVVTPLLEIAPGLRWPSGEPVRPEDAVEGRVVGMLGPL